VPILSESSSPSQISCVPCLHCWNDAECQACGGSGWIVGVPPVEDDAPLDPVSLADRRWWAERSDLDLILEDDLFDEAYEAARIREMEEGGYYL
jgi:hypothetical protein